MNPSLPQNRDRSKLLWLVAFLGALPLLAFPAAAADLWPYRVALLGPSLLFADPGLGPTGLATPNLSRQELNREILNTLKQDPRFQPIEEEEIHRADFQHLQQNQIYAQMADMYRLNGMEEFGRYDLDTAIPSLQQAIEHYLLAGAARATPREVAIAYEFLARAYIERAQTRPDLAIEARTNARAAFREMIRLNPSLLIAPDQYPREVVEIYRDAYYELLREDGRALDLDEASLQTLALQHQLDLLVYTYFLRDSRGLSFVLQVADFSGAVGSTREVLLLTDETGSSRERVSRAISRIVACYPLRHQPPPPPSPGDDGTINIQAGWANTFYGSRPTERYFFNQGLTVALSYFFTDYLALYGQATMLFGQRDPDGNLLSGFNSFRSIIGLILSYRITWFRSYFAFGIEGNRVGAFRATDDFWCKVTGGQFVTYEPGKDCLAHEIVIQPDLFLVGPHLRAGVSFDLPGPFSLFLAGDFAFYLFSQVEDLDFPFGAQTGVEYRF
ncbi:MAG: hypothetical protein JW797_19345 [Bradymonadales bacterium]|nr:hypothetical protein [Bradymonadales bacterium]